MNVNIVFTIVICISMVIFGIYVAFTKNFTLISGVNQTTVLDKHKPKIAYIFALCISLSAIFLMLTALSFEYDFIALAFVFLTIALLLIALFYVCFYKITKYP
ncbi:TPA: hypothetical protein ACGI1V_002752 [Staphylococcus argenteus]|uniref:Putative membrane protein n=1 Tax=Staphylococcus argenteus TaxID=985002 RepID=A0A7U7JRK1_9STAP|nr:hypothetical protein [Staphylococcus argenteus]BBN31209.1 hypothetical protein KUH140087_2082 [Staphylococcus aureus]ATY57932.1 hypothetical protein CJ017_12255 [Staphylococcus argenteus]ATZ88156.1 hypothetical protein CKO49_12250 [Staphylococcus argenteus]EKF1504508.1 hypothetical protein [Staphylococcus argenteus]EYG94107.1 hypothetical protein V676_00553 [Staphylococcus argenteus]